MGGVVAGHRVRGETEAHRRLKRRAVFWAQVHGYSACATEVSLPRCRYRADVAAYRRRSHGASLTAIFECKQAAADLRKDNCFTPAALQRLRALSERRDTLEANLRIHYPTLRTGDSLFPEFDSHDFEKIEHRAYASVAREIRQLKTQLQIGTKFETLVRYHCANLFFLVVPESLYQPSDVPVFWGALVECNESLSLRQKPVWLETTAEAQLQFLERIARAGTRQLNRQLEIDFEDLVQARAAS